MPMGGLGTTDKRLKDARGSPACLRALLRSLRFVNDDREGSRALLVESLEMPISSAAAAYDLGVNNFGQTGFPPSLA